ncbi:hypothetical protein Bra3105_17750 [Brachybacterium halotolerans subsp. kimchii]|uniref:VG15 protein n=1 Tax=Brachybacterium halotolerans TaxID=2795215 RepID=UPI001E471D57|nr:hypothetical protein [Brachybacterium halotolerans]UEJ82649.1 hypothetical protein Bra3105_17750 [Brachybacterium halotolerans subsp. kimchii]
MILAAYRLALDATRRAAEAAVGRLIRSMYDRTERDASIAALTPALTETVRAHRVQAHTHAVDMIRTQAEQQTGGRVAPYVSAPSGYSEASVRTVLEENLRGSPDEAVQIVAPMLGQHVEDAARQTVVRTVEDGREPASEMDRSHWSRDALTPSQFKSLEERQGDLYRKLRGLDGVDRSLRESRAVSWARMLTGAENCGFCVMLASRGPVYESASAAGRVKASDLYDTTTAGYVNTYHPNCDCLVVPIYTFEAWPGREDWRKLEQFYKDAIENADWDKISAKNPNLSAVEQALRRLEEAGDSLPITDLRGSVGATRTAA